jgi:hypothetical protein
MKKKHDKPAEKHLDDWEPDWLDPANDRKTPYTEEELKLFSEGFAESMSDTKALQDLYDKLGPEKAIETIKDKLRKQDDNNLINIDIKGPKH